MTVLEHELRSTESQSQQLLSMPSHFLSGGNQASRDRAALTPLHSRCYRCCKGQCAVHIRPGFLISCSPGILLHLSGPFPRLSHWCKNCYQAGTVGEFSEKIYKNLHKAQCINQLSYWADFTPSQSYLATILYFSSGKQE